MPVGEVSSTGVAWNVSRSHLPSANRQTWVKQRVKLALWSALRPPGPSDSLMPMTIVGHQHTSPLCRVDVTRRDWLSIGKSRTRPVAGEDVMVSRYHEVYESWKRDPQAFWAGAAEEIDWFRRWDKVFDPAAGVYGRWFPG